MKTLIKNIATLLFLFLEVSNLKSQIPEYALRASNFQPPLYLVTNFFSFDIYVIWTNPGVAPNYEYAGGQFFFEFNPNIANGGTLSYTYDTVGMSSGFGGQFPQALRTDLRPRNPMIFGSQLRLATNAPPGAGSGQFITNDPRGCVIIRMKLSTTASEFAHQSLDIRWRNNPLNPPSTKMNAYVGTSNTEITDTLGHGIFAYNNVLPVELSSFSSVINSNNVTLKWTTASERNNSGFDIERSMVNPAKSGQVGQWSMIGFIQGNGTTTTPKDYTYVDRGLSSGKYKYRLKQIDYNGSFMYFNLSNEVEVGVPKEYSISQNYPNPFNPTTKIDYELPHDGIVSITIYDITGREVKKLVNGMETAGYYTIVFEGSNLASGMYFYRIQAGEFAHTKRMVLLK